MGIDLSFIIYVLISTVTLSLLPSVDAAIHRVTHDDGRISYYPSTCDLDCTRVCRDRWWVSCLSGGAASHRTKGNNTQSSFSFQGSSVTWYTRTANDGGKAVVYIDDALAQRIDTNSPVVNEANPVFTVSDLDPTRPHKISVLYDLAAFTEAYERFVDVRYFEYDDGAGGGGGIPIASPVQSPTTTPGFAPTTSSQPASSLSSTSRAAGDSLTLSSTRPASTSAPILSPVAVTFQNGTVQTIIASGSLSGVTSPSPNTLTTGAVAGIVLGVAGVLFVFALCFFFGKRHQRRTGAIVDHSTKGANALQPSDSGTQSRPISLVSRAHGGGDAFTGTETFFHNIRNSHFYTLRNPLTRNPHPILYSDTSSSKRHLAAQYSTPNFPELRDEEQAFSLQPSQSYLASETSLHELHTDPRINHVPLSPDSGTRMTLMTRDSSGGAHAYSMTQETENRRDNRSSGGTWLPSTPPPQYIR